jgi:AraC family transcriptional regulator, dual regulator of chb operon
VYKHMHTHEGFSEIMYIAKGKGTHLINGRKQPLAAGDLLLIRTMDVHTFKAAKNVNIDYVNLSFPNETVFFLLERYFSKVPELYSSKEALPFRCKAGTAMQKWLNEKFRALAVGPKNRLEIEHFLVSLFRKICVQPEETTKTRTRPFWLRHACEMIREEKNLAEGVHGFVRLAGRSREYVARETMKWLGMSPSELVNQARLDYVASRLHQADCKVFDLALEAGFKSQSHFYEMFEQYFRVTPRVYRQRLQIALDNSLARKMDSNTF